MSLVIRRVEALLQKGYNAIMGAITAASINFGQDTFNYYDEGVWTPTYNAASGSPTITYLTQEGSYIRVGKQVTVWGRLGTSAFTAAGTAGMRIAGLPFPCANNNGLHFAGNIAWANDFTATGTPSGIYATESVSYLTLWKRLSADAQSELSVQLSETDFGTGASDNEIIFSCTYLTE